MFASIVDLFWALLNSGGGSIRFLRESLLVVTVTDENLINASDDRLGSLFHCCNTTTPQRYAEPNKRGLRNAASKFLPLPHNSLSDLSARGQFGERCEMIVHLTKDFDTSRERNAASTPPNETPSLRSGLRPSR